MPNRPPVSMGMYDPNDPKYRGDGRGAVVLKEKKKEELSTTAAFTELKVAASGEAMTIPVQVSTTVWDIKEMFADRLGIDPDVMHFIAKQGPYMREQKNHEEIARKVTIKGIPSFTRQRKEYPHPLAIIGAGHIGLRQAMVFLKHQEKNFVIFDKKPKVGGISWWDQANTTSKLQTELGVYHLTWDETMPIEQHLHYKSDYPWPSRDEILDHFDEVAREYGIMPYCRLSTNVKSMDIEGKREDTTYELTVEHLDDPSKKDEKFMASGVMLYPGNLSVARRDTYKGEEDFGGIIAYGMFNELDYTEITGKAVCIVGHGAFAVENVRTCLEFSAGQLYLVCRRKNISCPRFSSWFANQSLIPVTATLFLNSMKPMYDLLGWDVWNYYAVQSNAARTNCSIMQKARFGIGDVYFLAVSWGKLEVIEDPAGVKRVGPGALYTGSGRKLEVNAILKLLGFIGNWENDKLMKAKEIVGFWINEDPKRYLVAEPISVMASNFGGTSFSPGVIQWAYHAMHIFHYPSDFYGKLLESGMMPRHKPEGEDRPCYVVDARHGTSTMVYIGAVIPTLAERGPIEGPMKQQRMWALHPIDKFLRLCKEDWDYYCDKLRKEGLSGPEYPYTQEVAYGYYSQYMQTEVNQGVAPPAALEKYAIQ